MDFKSVLPKHEWKTTVSGRGWLGSLTVWKGVVMNSNEITHQCSRIRRTKCIPIVAQ